MGKVSKEQKDRAIAIAAKDYAAGYLLISKAMSYIETGDAELEGIGIKSEALTRNPKITEYEAIQKWDGKLPTYMLGNSTPFINIK